MGTIAKRFARSATSRRRVLTNLLPWRLAAPLISAHATLFAHRVSQSIAGHLCAVAISGWGMHRRVTPEEVLDRFGVDLSITDLGPMPEATERYVGRAVTPSVVPPGLGIPVIGPSIVLREPLPDPGRPTLIWRKEYGNV